MHITKKIAGIAAAGTMALGAVAPAVANAQVFGYGGYGIGGSCSLPQLFVLSALFGGGTNLGNLLILNQIFCRGGFGGLYW